MVGCYLKFNSGILRLRCVNVLLLLLCCCAALLLLLCSRRTYASSFKQQGSSLVRIVSNAWLAKMHAACLPSLLLWFVCSSKRTVQLSTYSHACRCCATKEREETGEHNGTVGGNNVPMLVYTEAQPLNAGLPAAVLLPPQRHGV
jgi:hypothetical protein